MSSKKKIFIVIGIIAIIVVSFVIGLLIGQKNAPKPDLATTKTAIGQTFYAKIESIKQYNDGSFHLNVTGLEVNDINYRGNYTFKVDDNLDMTWRGEKITVSDLKEGNIISITFTDETVVDISPTPLREVIKIQLLDDEIGEQKSEIKDKVTTIDIEEAITTGKNTAEIHTLNQEEIYEIFKIIDNLEFSTETCDALPSYYIKYNSESKNGFLIYGVEMFDDEYHITSSSKGEAKLSEEQRKSLDKIIQKYFE